MQMFAVELIRPFQRTVVAMQIRGKIRSFIEQTIIVNEFTTGRVAGRFEEVD